MLNLLLATFVARSFDTLLFPQSLSPRACTVITQRYHDSVALVKIPRNKVVCSIHLVSLRSGQWKALLGPWFPAFIAVQ